MEHISRGVLPSVNAIVLVSDCSRRGIQAVSRIAELVKEVDIGVDHSYLIVNRAPNGELNDGVREEIEKRCSFDEICFVKASPAITANCGPGTFGLLYLTKK
jgi:CO dehydrogenase nickel-insertion accessory protein CooC1